MSELEEVVAAFRSSAELRSKAAISLVGEVFGATDWLSGPGDDTAVLGDILLAGEAIWPPFVASDPYGAGIAAVVANVNDVAAMGGRPLGLVDHIVATEEVARRVLEGMKFAAALYNVPVVGGHLTIWDGTPSVSASIVGRTTQPLSATRVAPGQTLLLACCLDGTMRDDFPYFSSIRVRGEELAGDIALFAELAEQGLIAAAKDVSMAGILGSLAMLLEPTRCGATVDLEAIPRPDGVAMVRWTKSFPTFAFLLTAQPENAAAVGQAFEGRGLVCAEIATVDQTGLLRARLKGEEALLIDLNEQTVTGLASQT